MNFRIFETKCCRAWKGWVYGRRRIERRRPSAARPPRPLNLRGQVFFAEFLDTACALLYILRYCNIRFLRSSLGGVRWSVPGTAAFLSPAFLLLAPLPFFSLLA